MAYRVNIPNLSKGELAPELIARTDVSAYSAGTRRSRNVIIRKYGGQTKRMGTRFVAEAYDATKPVRLLPFQFSIEQAYALEMGQGYMRAAALGGMVLQQALTITAVTLGVTTTIAAAFHGYSVGDQVYLQGIAGTVELNGRMAKITAVPDAGHFVVDVDSRAFSAFTGDTGGIARTAPPVVPEPAPVVPDPVPSPGEPSTGGGGGNAANRHEVDLV